jgi:hypothetical protein
MLRNMLEISRRVEERLYIDCKEFLRLSGVPEFWRQLTPCLQTI